MIETEKRGGGETWRQSRKERKKVREMKRRREKQTDKGGESEMEER